MDDNRRVAQQARVCLSDDAARASVAAQTILIITQAEGCSVEVQGHRGNGGYARYRGTKRAGRVRLGSDVLNASVECQRWVGAHGQDSSSCL